MSKWKPLSKTTGRADDPAKTTHIYSGQKASHFTNKKGLDAQIDKLNMVEAEKKRLARYGTGTTRFALLDENGVADPTAIFEAGGLIFRPNKAGHFYQANESFLEEELKKEEEIRDYVKKILKYCVNDEVNKLIFAFSQADYEQVFGPTTAGKMDEYGIRCDDDVAKMNCKASYMESLLPDSASFHACTQKLIAIIRGLMPMIRPKELTHEKEKGEDTTPANLPPTNIP